MINKEKKLPELEFKEQVFADFGVRLGAIILDILILSPIILYMQYGRSSSLVYNTTVHIFFSVFIMGYYIFFMKKYGGTPGKLIAGIKIVKTDLSSINWIDAFKRNIVGSFYLLTFSTLTVYALSKNDNTIYSSLPKDKQANYINSLNNHSLETLNICNKIWIAASILSLLINQQKRTIHDYIAGTMVIRKKYLAAIIRNKKED